MLLQLENVWGGYHGLDIVKGVDCHLDSGDILCVVGPNGCGKTTLFRLILGFLSLSKGNIMIDGIKSTTLSSKEWAHNIAYIPQQHTPIFSYTVIDVVLMGRTSHLSTFNAPAEKDYEAAFAALQKLHIEHLANQKYDSLSGGQRQMGLIARAICQSARIFVMDEPSANLDYANQQALIEMIQELANNGYGIIMSTHSPEQPLSFGNKVLLMKDGVSVGFGDPKTSITDVILEDIYGIEMEIHNFLDRYGQSRSVCFPVSDKNG